MPEQHHTATGVGREVIELSAAEAMDLLASVEYGRVVFTRDALPAIRPVNHLVDTGRDIVRTRLTATLASTVRSRSPHAPVVAYEADDIDPRQRVGWSVVVTGLATTITDPDDIARYEQLLHPWVNKVMDTIVAIDPEIITGVRIVAATA
ncbi:pyridoxamine 5'-phosphate oxidase family protein [Mycolicibacterium sp.]|uniref:pyridoxamine 5'-phosphate oxidase family protein n=1 Tax=Mycolicibacterium sp. TaxID=2320850 RepID=UPI0037C568F0